MVIEIGVWMVNPTSIFQYFSFTFILGLCIGAIPDILEKDVNTILADILCYYFNDSRIIYIMILLDINEKLYEIK